MRIFIQILAIVALLIGFAQHSHGSEFVHVPGGEFRSVIPEAEGDNLIAVADFLVQEAPVTNAEFLQFVLHHEDWQRGSQDIQDPARIIHELGVQTFKSFFQTTLRLFCLKQRKVTRRARA